MRGITQQEHPPLLEPASHAVVDPVGRKPVDALDLDTHALGHVPADVLPAQRRPRVFVLRGYRADQPPRPPAFQGEDPQEVGVVERHVQLVVDHRPARHHVRDEEDVRIGPAGKADAQDLTHPRMGSVAAREIGRLTGFFFATSVLDPNPDAVRRLRKVDAEEVHGADGRVARRPALDGLAQRREPLLAQGLALRPALVLAARVVFAQRQARWFLRPGELQQ